VARVPKSARRRWTPPPLVAAARATIPSVDDISAEAFRNLRKDGLTDDHVRADFGDVLVRAEHEIERVYRMYEAKALDLLVDHYSPKLTAVLDGDGKAGGIRRIVDEAFDDVVAFEFSGGQSRKSRAGSAWEKLGPRLLDLIGIPCEKPTGEAAERYNQIDRIVPSIEMADNKPEQVIFLSFKRTFREKWRVLVDESRHGYVLLVSLGIGQDITKKKIREMSKKKLVVYVPHEVKHRSKFFEEAGSLREFNELPRDLARYRRELT
jgi:hypothetical protein